MDYETQLILRKQCSVCHFVKQPRHKSKICYILFCLCSIFFNNVFLNIKKKTLCLGTVTNKSKSMAAQLYLVAEGGVSPSSVAS